MSKIFGYRTLLAVLIVFFLVNSSFSQVTFTSNNSGNWNNPAIWTPSMAGDADGIPDSDDHVIIATGHTIDVNVNSASLNLTLNGTGILNFPTNNITLNVGGNLVMNGTSAITGNNNNRILNLTGNFTIPAGQSGSIGGIRFTQLSTSSFTLNGTFILTSNVGAKTVGNVTMNNASLWTATSNESVATNSFTIFNGAMIDAATNTATVNIGGNLEVRPSTPGLQANIGRSQIVVTGTTTIYAGGYFLFSASNSGVKRFNGTITNNLGGTWDNIIGEDPDINCSIVNNGVWPVPTGGNGRYDIETPGNYTYSGTSEIGMTRLRFRGAATVTNQATLRLTKTGNDGLTVDFGGTFINGNGGYLYLDSYTTPVTNPPAGSTVDFSPVGNTVEYSRAGNQNVFPTAYYNVIFSNGGTKTVGGVTSASNSVLIKDNTIVDVTGGTNFSGTANLTMNGTSEFLISTAGTVPEFTGSSHALAAGTTIEFYRAGTQTAASSASYPYQNLRINGNAGSAVNIAAVSLVNENLTITNQGTITNNGALTVNQNFSYTSTGASTLSGNIIVGNFIFSGGSLNYSNRTIRINGTNGTWTNNGGTLTNSGSSLVVFQNGTNQEITGTAVTTFPNLNINNANHVRLNNINAIVNNVLTFSAGNIITGTNVVELIGSASVTPTAGHVEGFLRKPVTAGNPILTFEVGVGANYTPVNINFSGVSVAGRFTVSASAGDHPDINGSNIEPNRSVNRYWSFVNNATTFTSLNAVFNYLPSDLDGLADFTNFDIKRYDAINWASATVGTKTGTTTQLTGETTTTLPNGLQRDYQIGELIPTSGTFNRVTGTANWSAPATWIQLRTGTIQLTSGSAIVTGSGTLFTTELAVGNVIMLQTTPGTTYTVASITNNTTLSLTGNSAITNSGGYGRQQVPNSINDVVTIGNSNLTDLATTITLDMNATVNSLDINTSASPRTTAQVLTQTNNLTVQTNVRVNQPGANSITDIWNINAATATVGGNVTIASSVNNAARIARVNITTGTLNVGTNLVFNTTNNGGLELAAVLNMAGGNGRVNLGGQLNFVNNRGLLLTAGAGSSFNFNRTSSSQGFLIPTSNQGANPWLFENVIFNNTSSSGVYLGSNMPAANLTGNLTIQSGLFRIGNADLLGNGVNNFIISPSGYFLMYGNRVFPAGFGTYNLGTAAPFGTVEFANTNAQAIPNHSYGNLIISSGGTNNNFTFGSGVTSVAGNLTLGNASGLTYPDVFGSAPGSTLSVAGNILIYPSTDFNATDISTINVGGNWTNNGNFVEATNSVVFNGSGIQTIGGTVNETFNNLQINTGGPTNTVQLLNNTDVSNTLTLTQGELNLNSKTLHVGTTAAGTITRTGGYIKSENTSAPFGTIDFEIGNRTGTFVFPFGKSSTEYLPYSMNITAAGNPASASVSVSTYPTGSNNLPFPPTVTNVQTPLGTDGTSVVDRFWQITLNGYTGNRPTATITFTAANSEIATTGPAATINAQRWNSGAWETALPGQVYTPGASTGSVTVPNVSSFSPWALASITAPLPVELKSFKAIANSDGSVELKWITASELNNQFFTIERSKNGFDFSLVQEIDGNGTTNEENTYSIFDEKPFNGLSYYRLKQTDFNNTEEIIGMISLFREGKETAFAVYPNPARSEIVHFTDKATIIVVNSLNQIVLKAEGIDQLDASEFPSGVYIIRTHKGETAKLIITK